MQTWLVITLVVVVLTILALVAAGIWWYMGASTGAVGVDDKLSHPTVDACTLGSFKTDVGKGEAAIKLYTESDCKTKLDGMWSANGECTKREGGSFSWDCRQQPTN